MVIICSLTYLFTSNFTINILGLRVGTLVSAFLMALGTAIRCISTNEDLFTWMAHLGANLNGVAGIVMCSVPPALSSLWFPPNERTTATAVSSVFNQLGNAGGFLLGPLLVRDPDENNQTMVGSSVAVLRMDIQRLMNIEALICTVLFLCTLIYFPARPRLPPSMASTVPRLNIKEGVIHLLKYANSISINLSVFKIVLIYTLRNREVLLLTAAFSFSQGILGGWLGVMDINLDAMGFNQVIP